MTAGGGGNSSGGGSSAPTSSPGTAPQKRPDDLPEHIPFATGLDEDGNPIDSNGERVPQHLPGSTVNTSPTSGYNKDGNLPYIDPDWQPEVGALDPVLRSATTTSQIVDHMNQKYADRGWDFSDLKNTNYEPGTLMHVESAREAAQAFDDIVTKYPFIEFSSISPLRASYEPETELNSQQRSNAFVQPGYGYHGAEYTSINAPMATLAGRAGAHSTYRKGRRDSETRDYNLDAMNRPAYYTMVHEMGHVVDFNGNATSHPRIKQLFEDTFEETPQFGKLYDKFLDDQMSNTVFQNRRTEMYKEWLSTQLVSAYSFVGSDRSRGEYMVETIAEAFLDVETRGTNAKPMSILIHQIVIEEAKKAKGVPL
jgi:hypothetical protein